MLANPGFADRVLEAMLYASAGAAQGVRRKAEPDWTHVHRELRRPGVTLMLLWEEYRASEPGGYSYSRWCELYRAWEGRLSPTMRQSHPAAGERMFVDFDGRSGEIRQAQIFVAVMGASSYTYAEASWTQSLPGKQAEVLGGLGSILGAFWGGHLIGIVRSARSHPAGTRTNRSVPVAKGDGSRVRT